MRKLCLASFEFKTGAETFKETRLLAIDSTPETPWETDHKLAIDGVFMPWFKQTYTESELVYVVCYETIDGTKALKKAPVFGYGVYSAHNMNDIPTEYGDSAMSRTMVVDMDGHRMRFQLAFYDFDKNDWVFMEDDTSLLEKKHAKWMDILPFANR